MYVFNKEAWNSKGNLYFKMNNKELMDRLAGFGFGKLSEKVDTSFVPTGSYALNKIVSGKYTEGVPIGQITQFYGEHSTAKTVFGTCILAQAQAKGYHTVIIAVSYTHLTLPTIYSV